MKYENIMPGIFIRRLNRFIAEIEIDGKKQACHVKNTGRLKELLVPGAPVYVQKAQTENRKTGFDLITVQKDGKLVNVDSQVPNAVVEEWLRRGMLLEDITFLKREAVFENSRFDLYAEYGSGRRAFLEVKGVTLETDGAASFPDAPTGRGIKHLGELCRCLGCGYDAFLIFVIQMKGIRLMRPNWNMHPEFGEMLVTADRAGVHVLAYDCVIQPDSIVLDEAVPVSLARWT